MVRTLPGLAGGPAGGRGVSKKKIEDGVAALLGEKVSPEGHCFLSLGSDLKPQNQKTKSINQK